MARPRKLWVGEAKRGGSREVQYSEVYWANLAIRSVMIISQWDMLGVDTEVNHDMFANDASPGRLPRTFRSGARRAGICEDG